MTKKGFPYDPINREAILTSPEFINGVKPIIGDNTIETIYEIIFCEDVLNDIRDVRDVGAEKQALEESVDFLELAMKHHNEAMKAYVTVRDQADAFLESAQALYATSNLILSQVRSPRLLAYNARKARREPLNEFAVYNAFVWRYFRQEIRNDHAFKSYLTGIFKHIAPHFVNPSAIRGIVEHCRQELGIPSKRGRPRKIAK